MKTVTGMWIATIVTGLWLLFVQPAHASDIRSCHLLHPSDLNSQAIVSPLPEAQLAQLKTTFTANRSDSLDHGSSDYSKLSGQTENIAVYHAIVSANRCGMLLRFGYLSRLSRPVIWCSREMGDGRRQDQI